MNELRMIYVPIALVQIAEELKNENLRQNQREMFMTRLEAARDFADEILAQYQTTNMPTVNNVFRK